MIILDKPFISLEMKDYISQTQVPVLNNPMALSENDSSGFKLETAEGLIKRYHQGDRIYTASENSLEWIIQNIDDQELLRGINIMKNKVEFRELLAGLYPDYYFRRLTVEELKSIDFDSLPVPVILKPAIGFFSIGVYTIQSLSDWQKAIDAICQQAEKWSAEFPRSVVDNTTFIIEQYIVGDEYALDAYYDDNGEAVILNIMKHDFSSAQDVSDRLYYTSKEIVVNNLDRFSHYLNEVNQIFQVKNFPFHVEIRVDNGAICPIEFNPMRFAGWCCTDITYFAFGFRTYDYYLNNRKPQWDELLSGKDGKVYPMIVLNKPEDFVDTWTFDYEKLCTQFQKVLCLRKIDYRKHGALGFVFSETTDTRELDYIIKADLTEYCHQV